MLSELYVANFKSLGDKGVILRPRPLTVLTGANGSGKSSIPEALCLLAQSIGSSGLRSDGEFVKFGSDEAFIHKRELNRLLQISLTIDEITTEGRKSPGALYAYRQTPTEVIQRALSSESEIVSLNWEAASGSLTFTREDENLLTTPPQGIDPRSVLNPDVFRIRIGIVPPSVMDQLNIGREIVSRVASFLRERFFFISAFRGGAEFYLRSQSVEDPRWVGANGAMTNHILSKMNASRQFDQQAQRVAVWAEKFELGGLKAGWVGAGQLRSDYIEPKLETVIDTVLASHGSRQALSFITQIFWSPAGTTLVIEEPEISLHPEAQTLLPSLFAEAIKRGVQIIVTTHSPFLVSSLWKPVSEREISASDMAVYHFEKEPTGSTARILSFGIDGRLKEYVPSFEKVESKFLSDAMDNAPKA